MEPLDFLKTARKLNKTDYEADQRSAVSRAYYGVFNYVKKRLKGGGITYGKTGTVHRDIEKDLRNCGLPDFDIIGNQFGDLLTDRTQADYDMNDHRFIPPRLAALAIAKAQSIIDEFQKPRLSDIAKGIQAYRKNVGN